VTAFALLAVLALALLVRLPLLYNATHSFNSDEAINALTLARLLEGRELRLHNWGTPYFGIQESLLAIPFVLALGLTPLAFKLTALLGTLFLIACVFLLARRLYGRAAGVVAAAIAAVFSPQVVRWSHLANVGYGLVMGWGCLTFLWLVRTARQPTTGNALVLGLLGGFGFYMYELFAVFLATLVPVGLAVVMRGGAKPLAKLQLPRRLRLMAAMAGGFALGWAPRLEAVFAGADNAKEPTYALAGLLRIQSNARLLFRDAGPAFLGANPGARPELEPLVGPSGPYTPLLGWIVLALFAGVWVWGARRLWRRARSAATTDGETLLQGLVVVLVPVTIAAFLATPNAQDVHSNRYLLPLVTALPVLAAGALRGLWRIRPILTIPPFLMLVLFPTWQTAGCLVRLGYLTPRLELQERAEPVVKAAAYLAAHGVRGAYADYWFAYKATFLTGERLIATTFRGWDRRPAYTAFVNRQPNAAYVFMEPLGPLHASFLDEVDPARLVARAFGPYHVITSVDGERLLPPELPRPAPLRSFAADLELGAAPAAVAAGTSFSVPLRLRNRGSQVWHHQGVGTGQLRVAAAYRWLDPQGTPVVLYGERTLLPRGLLPGEEATLDVAVVAPPAPGPHVLRVTLVQEEVAWFDDQGVAAERTIEVR
jgi:hypothetical protein